MTFTGTVTVANYRHRRIGHLRGSSTEGLCLKSRASPGGMSVISPCSKIPWITSPSCIPIRPWFFQIFPNNMPPSPRELLARRQRKNERAKLKRRQNRLFEYTDEFGKLFYSKMYLLIRSKEGEFSIYKSCKDFPPRRSELSSLWEHNTRQSLEKEGNGRIGSRARINSTSKLDMRKKRLLGYADAFAKEFSAKVYLLIQLQSGNLIDYRSSCSKSWPPSRKHLVCRLLLPVEWGANSH